MQVVETERLVLRWFCLDDAAFILQLLNDPGWLRFIGDKGVRSVEDARTYLANGPIAMYARTGFGLYLVLRKADQAPIGMCGLIRREGLDDVDIGFAFLPAYASQGYAREAAAATLAHGKRAFGMKRVVAITTPDNEKSIRLLEKIGLAFEKMVTVRSDEAPLVLMAKDFA